MRKLIFLLILVPVQLLFAQTDVLTPKDIARLEYVSSAEISNDGSKIAYTVVKQANPTKENSSTSLKLWIHDVKTGTSNQFITQGSVRGIAFRPHYNSVTFLANRGGDEVSALYEIPMTGGEASKIYFVVKCSVFLFLSLFLIKFDLPILTL